MPYNATIHENVARNYVARSVSLTAPRSVAELYAERESQFLGVWERDDGWRVKAYGIPFNRPAARAEMVAAAKAKALEVLPSPHEDGTPGVGVVIVHDAEDYGFILVQWWANNIELHQDLFYAEIDEPGQLYPVPSKAFGCMYELEITDFERRLYMKLLREGEGVPDLDAYLSQAYGGRI